MNTVSICNFQLSFSRPILLFLVAIMELSSPTKMACARGQTMLPAINCKLFMVFNIFKQETILHITYFAQ